MGYQQAFNSITEDMMINKAKLKNLERELFDIENELKILIASDADDREILIKRTDLAERNMELSKQTFNLIMGNNVLSTQFLTLCREFEANYLAGQTPPFWYNDVKDFVKKNT